MKPVNSIQKQIDSYEKERILMNVQEFDHLLKRVNIEEDNAVKQRMLTVIEQYLSALSSNTVVVPDVEKTVAPVETVTEDVVLPVTEETVLGAELDQNNAAALYNQQMEQEAKEEDAKLAEELLEAKEQEEAAVKYEAADMNTEEVQTVEDMENEAKAKLEEAEQVELPIDTPIEEPTVKVEPVTEETVETVEAPVDETEYVEEFGLISTAKEEEHMSQIIERGGVIFREKRSFMLMLCLDDEVVAIAKTIKLEQFPEHVQKHLKGDGFITCDVVSFGEVTKRSRARYTNVTYKNLQLLEKDHWVVKNVTNLLEKGEVPEHVKEDEAKEVVAEEKPVQVVEPTTQEEVEEKPFIVSSFMLHPSFVGTFANQKEAVMAQKYGISSADGIARLFTQNANGTVVVGVDEKTALKPNNYMATILDYTMKEQDGKTYAQFKLDASVIEPTVQPAPVAQTPAEETQTEQVAVEVVAKGEVPSDFPLTNEIALPLHPMAESMFSLEAAKAMVGQVVHLGLFIRPEEQLKRVSLMYDVFEMATASNTLTKETMRNSKWLARITDVNLLVDQGTQRKSLFLVFDRLEEVAVFPYEKEEEAREVTTFLPINEEVYAERQQELANAHAVVKTEAAPVETQTTPVVENAPVVNVPEETVSAEALMNKEYNPVEAKQLINPTAGTNYTQGYQELVQSQAKDMSGAVQEIRNQTQVLPTSRQELTEAANGLVTGVINQTLKETGIHTQTEEKQTVQVMGNLQDGAGNLTQTETVIRFATGYSPQSWAQSVGKRIDLKSELQLGNGPVTSKLVTMVGKNGAVVAQGQVPMTEALLLDGNQHSATLLGIEGATQEQHGYVISLRLGEFNKVA
ncbi:hypothetical protein COK00_11700 [Bacillus cereus]|uniref:hypothetical protein n=1 Tax=Bacillus cereus TaxID=1396 RepID=UPI000BF5C46F|nr:hypothetical protein [Bacillus cereus]PFP65260.1 hypothetical protein COK00_11700 [Bacillus cereus]